MRRPPGGASAGAVVPLVALCAAAEEGNIGFGLVLDVALARAAGGEAATAPEWIPLLPAPGEGGVIKARDGREWTLPDPSVVPAYHVAQGADAPLDIEHATHLLAPEGHPAPAQAWIKEMKVREDRSTWGRVEWTAAGLASWQSGGWKYVSPGILYSDAGEIFGLASAGLVTKPALHMPALARDGSRKPNPEEQPTMPIALATLIGVAGLASTASETDVLTALTANAAAARDIQDVTKFVPTATLNTALARATEAEAKLADRDKADAEAAVTALVERGIAEGKIIPATKEHFLAIARADSAAFTTALAAMPVVVKVTDTGKKPGGADGAGDPANHGLSESQLALCSSLNVTPEAFAKTLKEQAQ